MRKKTRKAAGMDKKPESKPSKSPDEKDAEEPSKPAADENAESKPAPILFPCDPFPPPSPPQCAPRTGAWQQVWHEVSECEPGEEAGCAINPKGHRRNRLGAWIQWMRHRPVKERILEITHNKQTNQWDIVELPPGADPCGGPRRISLPGKNDPNCRFSEEQAATGSEKMPSASFPSPLFDSPSLRICSEAGRD